MHKKLWISLGIYVNEPGTSPFFLFKTPERIKGHFPFIHTSSRYHPEVFHIFIQPSFCLKGLKYKLF